MASQQDVPFKRRSSLRRLDFFRPHVAHSITSVARTNSTRSTTLTEPSEASPLYESHNEVGLFTSAFKRRHTLRRMAKSKQLSIQLPEKATSQGDARTGLASPHTPLTPLSPRSPPPPTRPAPNGNDKGGDVYGDSLKSPVQALPHPPSPKSPKHKSSKIFSNMKGSKSSTKVNKIESPRPPLPAQSSSAGSKIYTLNAQNQSSPDIREDQAWAERRNEFAGGQPSPQQEGNFDLPSLKDGVGRDKDKRRDKHKFGNILSRKGSIPGDLSLQSLAINTRPSNARRAQEEEDFARKISPSAPLEREGIFRQHMESRNRSLDRQGGSEDEKHVRSQQSLGSNGLPSTSGSSNSKFFLGIRSSGSKAADGVNRARKGIFGKLTRSGSSHDRDAPAANISRDYKVKVIYLGLIEQTRITRISKRLELSKDKTEFWMPALPWRCIDYLNLHGTTAVGLYRIPGSKAEIDRWIMRFDTEHDINLFNEKDLYDVNAIAGLLKNWLNNLKDRVLPEEFETRILELLDEMDPPPETAPQFLKDELSKLPPWNYYLLFAITCHLSLLHNCKEENKMTFNNIKICILQPLKINHKIFELLILDWKNCWQGCITEREYLEKEYQILEEMQAGATSSKKSSPPNGSAPAGKDAYHYSLNPPPSGSSSKGSKPQTLTFRQIAEASPSPKKYMDDHADDDSALDEQYVVYKIPGPQPPGEDYHGFGTFYEKSAAPQISLSGPRSRAASPANARPKTATNSKSIPIVVKTPSSGKAAASSQHANGTEDTKSNQPNSANRDRPIQHYDKAYPSAHRSESSQLRQAEAQNHQRFGAGAQGQSQRQAGGQEQQRQASQNQEQRHASSPTPNS